MRQDCLCKTKTVKVPRGNAFQLLMPFKTAHWEDESIVPEDLDILSLDNVHITIAGIEWTDFEMDPRGPIVTIGADDFDAAGAYSAEITAEYCGVPIRGAFFECFTRVEWSFESNVEQHLPDSPLIAETSYVYIGITDDQELEDLKHRYELKIVELQAAIQAAEQAKQAYEEAVLHLDGIAQEETSQAILQGMATKQDLAGLAEKTDLADLATKQDIAGLAEKTDLAGLATAQNVTDAKNEILAALPQEASAEFIQSLFANES